MEHIKDYMNEILLSSMESNDGMQAETNSNLEYDINYKDKSDEVCFMVSLLEFHKLIFKEVKERRIENVV